MYTIQDLDRMFKSYYRSLVPDMMDNSYGESMTHKEIDKLSSSHAPYDYRIKEAYIESDVVKGLVYYWNGNVLSFMENSVLGHVPSPQYYMTPEQVEEIARWLKVLQGK